MVNGVFLVALCLSIVLDAIQRFAEPQEVSNPKLVLIVGGVGLAFNILGLFVFHQHSHGHSHDHGSEEHADGAKDVLNDAEQGHSQSTSPTDAGLGKLRQQDSRKVPGNTQEELRVSTDSTRSERSPLAGRSSSTASRWRNKRSRSMSQVQDMPVHPAFFRNEIIHKARMSDDEPSEVSPLLGRRTEENVYSNQTTNSESYKGTKQDEFATSDEPVDHHQTHKHAQPQPQANSGHSHDDMNIKGIFFHVLGDALGNVGVMASALIIWLTPWSFRFYFDPAISLLITLIILKSALPLCRDTAKPLLQAVPGHISVEDIQDDINDLPGVRNCHHVHVWALTPAKLIATLDVELDFDFEGRNANRYMALAKEIKSCLHGHGIHSSTVQPEFNVDATYPAALDGADLEDPLRHNSSSTDDTAVGNGSGSSNSRAALPGRRSVAEGCGIGACLLDCKDACSTGKQCCGPTSRSASGASTPKRNGDDDRKLDATRHR